MLNKNRMLTPGPTMVPDRVRLAMAQEMPHHRKPPFKAIMNEAQAKLRKLFGTAQPVMSLACSGTGGMTAAVENLFSAGEKVIVVEGGKFGERWSEISALHKLETVIISVEWGCAVTPESVKKALAEHPDAKGVLLQLSETSTGVLHPVKDIAAITADSDVLLVADGISAVGISPVYMDEWNIDCLITGSQKGLMLPPGLALVALSEKAWRKAESVEHTCYYFDLKTEKNKVEADQTKYTSPVSLLMGLNESLAMYFEAGLENIFRKQWAMTMMARTGVAEMGLDLLAKDHFTWGLTSIRLPEGMSAASILGYAAEHYGVTMAGGQGAMKDTIIRMGHMGWTDWADVMAGLHALAESFTACGGYIGSRDYLEKALQAYHEALSVDLNTVI